MVLLKGEQWRRRTMGTTTSIQKFRGCRCHACCRYTIIVFFFFLSFTTRQPRAPSLEVCLDARSHLPPVASVYACDLRPMATAGSRPTRAFGVWRVYE